MHYEYIFYIKKEKMSNKQPEVYFYVPYADALQVREDEEKYTYANGIASRRKFLKSPLNYIGGKYKLLPQLIEFFPDKINTFVDLFSGGFNVGINVDCNKVVCNDMNTFIIDLYKELYSKPIDETLNKITGRIKDYQKKMKRLLRNLGIITIKQKNQQTYILCHVIHLIISLDLITIKNIIIHLEETEVNFQTI